MIYFGGVILIEIKLKSKSTSYRPQMIIIKTFSLTISAIILTFNPPRGRGLREGCPLRFGKLFGLRKGLQAYWFNPTAFQLFGKESINHMRPLYNWWYFNCRCVLNLVICDTYKLNYFELAVVKCISWNAPYHQKSFCLGYFVRSPDTRK